MSSLPINKQRKKKYGGSITKNRPTSSNAYSNINTKMSLTAPSIPVTDIDNSMYESNKGNLLYGDVGSSEKPSILR